MANKVEEAIAKMVGDRFAELADPLLYIAPHSWSDRPSNIAASASDPAEVPDNPALSYFIWGYSTWGGPTASSDIIGP